MFRFGFWLVVLTAALLPRPVAAFCGFYVSGADASLYNDATMVVLMREGTRTVLSMQNSYQGPPEAFAMVVPVPVVLQEENVKTLDREIFKRVDSLAAPRLVEYWEQDPCAPQVYPQMMRMRAGAGGPPMAAAESADADLGVTVEAQFAVGEYDIVILSARDSSGLDTWLRQEKYNIPQGAESVLRPYVAAGTKFFVAKVDVKRVTFENGKAVLSPLRVHYDSEEFALPVRLGLLNSSGDQDLIVHILARNQRYEVANYPNVPIPTNIRVKNAVRDNFGGFYEALFERTRSQHERSVVTEYSWNANTCDPCPTPALNPGEIATLGGDVLENKQPFGFVLTRLHYRYQRDDLGEDLVFRAAPPIVGGRGTPNTEGELEEKGAKPGPMNNFQGRYAILHPWEGKVECDEPHRGNWGGPPNQPKPQPIAAGSRLSATPVAAGAAPVLGSLVAQDVPELNLVEGEPAPEPEPTAPATQTQTTPTPPAGSGGCASCSVGPRRGPPALGVLGALGCGAWLLRRRRRRA